MDKIIKTLNGFSGSKVYLIENSKRVFVRKIGNVDRNYERLLKLSESGFNVPKIYNKTGEVLDIEYIQSLDMKTYLEHYSLEKLSLFLLDTLSKLSEDNSEKDYSNIYKQKLEEIDFKKLPFGKQELLEKLPKKLPSSNYFGDLTLENVLYGIDEKFYLIDCSTIEYDSYIFDIAKLRQDLRCKWFLRNHKTSLEVYCDKLENNILTQFPEASNDYFLILMLLRVYRHAKENSFEQIFLLREIEKLWK